MICPEVCFVENTYPRVVKHDNHHNHQSNGKTTTSFRSFVLLGFVPQQNGCRKQVTRLNCFTYFVEEIPHSHFFLKFYIKEHDEILLYFEKKCFKIRFWVCSPSDQVEWQKNVVIFLLVLKKMTKNSQKLTCLKCLSNTEKTFLTP